MCSKEIDKEVEDFLSTLSFDTMADAETIKV
jgi:hypothetical protein